MSERNKVIIYVFVFIIVLIGVSLFMNMSNSNNSKKQDTVKEAKSNVIIEINEDNFEEEVIKCDRKVLIDFYATWCGPCKSLEPVIEEVAQKNEDLKVVQIDVDKNRELTNKYSIQAMPTLIVVENGDEINRSVGVIPKSRILEVCGME